MTAFRLCPVLLAGLLSTASSNALAQSPRPMGLVDLLNIPRLGDPQLSLPKQKLGIVELNSLQISLPTSGFMACDSL